MVHLVDQPVAEPAFHQTARPVELGLDRAHGNAERSGALAEDIALRWPAVRFRLAQSVERMLPAEESWAGVPAVELRRQAERWRTQLQPVGVSGLDWQAWTDFPK